MAGLGEIPGPVVYIVQIEKMMEVHMRFFSSEETRIYFAKISQKLKDEVEKMSDVEINTCELQEWKGYLYEKYQIVPLVLFEESIEHTLVDTKVKKYNHFYGSLPFEQEYYLVDGVRIIFSIPFDGDPGLFWLLPTSCVWDSYEVEDFHEPYGKECGNFVLEFEYSKRELEDKGEKMLSFVEDQFENRFRTIRTMVGNVNSEVLSFNNRLEDFALKCLQERKARAASLSFISKMLEIPLNKSNNSPNTKPIPLERVVRKPTSKPELKPITEEYTISDWDYENINNIILMCGNSMEKTARTHSRNNEEELRDFLLATLNTHYDNVTGETFRKIGKTDIHIEFENKAAFIGECKIWHGEKKFEQAIQQVLDYSTWKDIKVSVIVFNKENQSFSNIVDKIQCWVQKNATSYNKKASNYWDCKYYCHDKEVEIGINILAFDLYVNQN